MTLCGTITTFRWKLSLLSNLKIDSLPLELAALTMLEAPHALQKNIR